MLAALNKLGVKVFVATALVVVVALGGALFLTKRKADAAANESITRALGATRLAIQGTLDSREASLRQTLGILATQPSYIAYIQKAITGGRRGDLLAQAGEFQDQTKAAWVMVLDRSGVMQAWTLHNDQFGDTLAEASPVRIALEGGKGQGLWVEVDPSGHDVLYQAVSVPVTPPGSGNVVAVVIAAHAIDMAFADTLKTQTNSEIVFFTLDTLGHPRPALTTLPAGVDVGGAIGGMGGAEGGGTMDSTHVQLLAGGQEWIGTIGPLLNADGEPLGGYVGLRSRDVELAAFTALKDSFPTAFIAGLLIALLSSLAIARTVTGPVNRLVRATRDVREGKLSGEIVVGTRDEIGELADAFRRMVGELKEKQDLVDLLSTGGGAAATVQMGQGDVRAVTSGPNATRPSSMGISLMPGQTLSNRYEIKEVLGAGGMGVVFRAWDRDLQEAVAIKTLKPEVMDPQSIERFKQEIRLARKISHRNVVRNYDLGESDGMLYITMEYVEGTSLEKLLRQRGKLPVSVALTVGKQLLRALEAAHEMGVIHRDIKPQNIVVEPTGLVKVMDFGIARLAETHSHDSKGLTAVGSVIGTPQYMSPEQLMASELDVRSDLYAAGAVLFECLTGRVVFQAPTVTALILAQVEQAAPDPRTLNPAIPHDLALIVLKALEKAREARWATAAEFSAALDEVELQAGKVGDSGQMRAVTI
ncbi:MAG: protein kinase [Gemmatimonadetes bacterium]|nr:protein kinase [Gemmatimonadota bacterium]